MPKTIVRLLFTLTLMTVFAFAALAQSTHSVWSSKAYVVTDPTTTCTYTSFAPSVQNSTGAWTEPTPGYAAAAHFRAFVSTTGFGACQPARYEFALMSSGTTTIDTVTGKWLVKKNGVIVCNGCAGTASGLSQAANGTNYFTVSITPATGGAQWRYSGFLNSRFDF